jgi:hypothetical protein
MCPEQLPARGLALPLVLVLGAGCHLMVGLLLESVRGEVRVGPALIHAANALDASDQTLAEAAVRLRSSLTFPVNSCAGGLCANRQAPAPETYDWSRGTAHATASTVSHGGYWIESLGTLLAGQSADCAGSSGGCEYVRVIASAAPGEVRSTLEACYRIRRASGVAPVVTRLSWRQTKAP